MFQQRDQFAYARWITALSKSEGRLVAPVACLSSVYLWRNQCWMLRGEICGLWLFPSHTNTCTNSGMHACTPSGWTWHWIDKDPLAVITEILTCYFNVSAQNDAKQIQLTGSGSFLSWQTHDARLEWREGPVFHSRWLPGQPQTGCHCPK